MKLNPLSSRLMKLVFVLSLLATNFSQVAAAPQSTAFSIGQSYGGGIIFWIDATGQHGLIADKSDTSYLMIWWGDRYYPLTGATGTAVGTGVSKHQENHRSPGDKVQLCCTRVRKLQGWGLC